MHSSPVVLLCAIVLFLGSVHANKVGRKPEHEVRDLNHHPVKALSHHHIHQLLHHHNRFDSSHKRWLRCKLVKLELLKGKLEQVSNHLKIAEAIAEQTRTRVLHYINKKSLNARDVKIERAEEKKALGEFEKANEEERRLGNKKDLLVRELKSLFGVVAAFRRKLSVHMSEVKRKEVETRTKLYRNTVQIKRIGKDIRRLKMKIAKQLRKSKEYRQRKAELMRKETEYEAEMAMKIKSRRHSAEKEKHKFRQWLKMKRAEEVQVRQKIGVLKGEIAREEALKENSRLRLKKEHALERHDAKLWRAQQRHHGVIVLALRRIKRKVKHAQAAENLLHDQVQRTKRKLQSLREAFHTEEVHGRREVHAFIHQIRELTRKLDLEKADKKRTRSRLETVLRRLKRSQHKNHDKEQALKRYQNKIQIFEQQSAHHAAAMKLKIARLLHHKEQERSLVVRLKAQLLSMKSKLKQHTRVVQIFKKRMASAERKARSKLRFHKQQYRHARRRHKHLHRKWWKERHAVSHWIRRARAIHAKKVRMDHELQLLEIEYKLAKKRLAKKLLQKKKEAEEKVHYHAMSKRLRAVRINIIKAKNRTVHHLNMEKSKIAELTAREHKSRAGLAAVLRSEREERAKQQALVVKTRRMKHEDTAKLSHEKEEVAKLKVELGRVKGGVAKMLKRLHETKTHQLGALQRWEKEEVADNLRLRRFKARVAAEAHSLHNLERQRILMAHKRKLSLAAAKNTLSGYQKEVLRMGVEETREKLQQERLAHRLLKKISHKKDDLRRLKKNNAHILEELHDIQRRKKELRLKEAARRAAFQRKFNILKLQREHLQESNLRTSQEIQHRHTVIDKLRKSLSSMRQTGRLEKMKEDQVLREKGIESLRLTAEIRRGTKRHMKKIHAMHEHLRQMRRTLHSERAHVEEQRHLLARLHALLVQSQERALKKLVLLRKLRHKENLYRADRKAKRAKRLLAYNEKRKHQESEIQSETTHYHNLVGRVRHKNKAVNQARHELTKEVARWRRREARAVLRKNLNGLRKLRKELKLLKQRGRAAIKTQRQKWRIKVEKQKKLISKDLQARKQEKATLLLKLAEKRNLLKKANGEKLLFRSMHEKEKKYEASYAKNLKVLESKWKLKINRARSLYKQLHTETLKLLNKLRMEKLKELHMQTRLHKYKAQLTNQSHKDSRLKQALHHKHTELRKAQQNWKRISTEFEDQGRERQKKLAKQSHRVDVLRKNLKLLRMRFHKQRLHERRTANTYRQLILHGKERLKKMTNENNLMMSELRRWKSRLSQEFRREKLQKIRNALTEKRERIERAKEKSDQRRRLRALKARMNKVVQRVQGMHDAIKKEKTMMIKLAAEYKRRNRNEVTRWHVKQNIIAKRIAKARTMNRILKKKIEDDRLEAKRSMDIQREKHLLKLRKEKSLWRKRLHDEELKEKNSVHKWKDLQDSKKAKFELTKSGQETQLEHLKARIRKERQRRSALKKDMGLQLMKEQAKLKKERITFKEVQKKETAKEETIRANIDRLQRVQSQAMVNARLSQSKATRKFQSKLTTLQGDESLKMHRLHDHEAKIITGLMKELRINRRALAEQKRHLTIELAELRAKERHDEQVWSARIQAKKREIQRTKSEGAMVLKNTNKKWRLRLEKESLAVRAQLAKWTARREGHRRQLGELRHKVTQNTASYNKAVLAEREHRQRAELSRRKALRTRQRLAQQRDLLMSRLKLDRGEVRKLLHSIMLQKGIIWRARGVHAELVKATNAFKAMQGKWKRLEEEEASEKVELKLLRAKLALTSDKIKKEKLRINNVTESMKHKLEVYEAKSRNVSSAIVVQEKLLKDGREKLMLVLLKLKKAKKAKLQKQLQIKNKAKHLERLGMKARNIRAAVLGLQTKLRIDSSRIIKYEHRIRDEVQKSGALRKKLVILGRKLGQERSRAKKYSMQTQHERNRKNQLNAELAKALHHFKLTSNAERHLLVHEKDLRKSMRQLKKEIRHIHNVVKSEKHKFKYQINKEHRGFKSMKFRDQQAIESLSLKLKSNKLQLAHVEKTKFATVVAHKKVLRLLKVQRERMSQQNRKTAILKREFHAALEKERFVEGELKKQMKFSRQLKKVLACGRWRFLSSRQKKYSELLRQGGFKLKQLFKKLRLVDDKVHNLTKMLRRVALERKEGEKKVQKELVEAAHHIAKLRK